MTGTGGRAGRGRGRRAALRVRRVGRAVASWPRRAAARWRSSLQVRVVTSSLVVGIVVVAVLGAYLSVQVRNGLFDRRVDQILQESQRSTQQAQSTFDAASAKDSTEVQQLLNDTVPQLQQSGSGNRDVFLVRPAGSTAAPSVVGVSTTQEFRGLVSDDLRSQVENGQGQYWQSVAIPQPDGSSEPGVVVGSRVTLPVVGDFELYYLYSLADDESTLRFVQSVLAIGAIVLLGLVGATTFLVARQVVVPVRNAARVAGRLADGRLDERLAVRGTDEMATLGRAFNGMAESLQVQIARWEELSTLQRRFVSDVSHELRTPLTTIRMAGEVIYASRDEFEPASRRSAELLRAQIDRFEELLADLLEISRFDAGAVGLEAERSDLSRAVDAVVEHVLPLAESKGVWISANLPERPVIADLDTRRIERVLRNLVVNAVEHAEGGPVEIDVAADERAAAVVVRDFGVGLTQDETGHVFDRFWRADPARARTTGGTGLGLAIALEDAHLHGGWLEAWGRPGRGASFRLTVPRRAGILLTESPLPLVPASEVPRSATPDEIRDTADGPSGLGRGTVPSDHGPAALPQLHAAPEGDR
ncbi:MtrAB system histidine kinase MtrB [Luteimicrobium subarcticum]|uniref:Sensor histidine kinase MtrB n=1 Tax=Luteimicrobium subarcticum TaxID=620910 RepID=A0A2M8WWB3_9MICO|nr:MtrAB system histidine kinase MtrB [Luteimicrobium subarcticum]PJI95205.1 two-component system sensor histidine kinase MtrB [Luteimicrobium subarcticum]